MALSQGLGPDLCENRSAPGTPPHGGAARGHRDCGRRTVPAMPRRSRLRTAGHLPAARPRSAHRAPAPGGSAARGHGATSPAATGPGRDTLPLAHPPWRSPGPQPPGAKNGFIPTRRFPSSDSSTLVSDEMYSLIPVLSNHVQGRDAVCSPSSCCLRPTYLVPFPHHPATLTPIPASQVLGTPGLALPITTTPAVPIFGRNTSLQFFFFKDYYHSTCHWLFYICFTVLAGMYGLEICPKTKPA